jgi:hypothetical protein
MSEEIEEVPRPELVVMAEPGAAVRAGAPDGDGVFAPPSAGGDVDAGGLAGILAQVGAVLRPLWEVAEDTVISLQAEVAPNAPDDLSTFYRVDAPPEQLDSLAEQLRGHEAIAGAWVAPPTVLPGTSPAGVATPDLTGGQGYLEPAPGGIDARFAWNSAGGDGTGVAIIDIEGGWRFTHEDLGQNNGGLLGGVQFSGVDWRNHGTAVFGEIGGDDNGFGVIGISPSSTLSAISHGTGTGGSNAAKAIFDAANLLQAGDLMLLEMHRPGPAANFQLNATQFGYIAVEWWPDVLAAIRFATEKGVIVIEAAGNGAQYLDDPLYDTPAPGFPPTWVNPFRRLGVDSGAIIVGAGAPPPGTHGRDHGPDRSRLDFSNFGLAVDCQGWGREVTTTGYRDLHDGGSEDFWYTDTFSGTSSASPIVTGAVACTQGILRAAGQSVLAPWKARQLLRATGSPQQDHPARPHTERIGRRPDLAALVPRATNPPAIPMARLNGETWGRGYSSVQSFLLGGAPHLLAYKAFDWTDDQGSAQSGGPMFIAAVDASGQQCTFTHQDTWTAGWSTMLMMSIGGAPHLVSYKAGVTGETNAAIDAIAEGGAGVVGSYTGEWRADWTALAGWSMDGGDLLLCYGSGGDQISLDAVAADATGFTHTLVGGVWEAGWTHLLVHDLPDGPHLFTGQAGGGAVSVSQIHRDGSMSRRFAERWQPAWALFAGFDLAGERYQISYQPSTGWAAIDRVLPDGDGFETLSWHDLGVGHTALTVFPSAGGLRALVYSSDTGEAAYWSIG